jgi:prepilin-type N-terminal cleavage/methylation domain-containing protein
MMMEKQKGFTLIEIVITVAIIGIASTVVLAGLGGGRAEREVEASAREFASVVREAQNYALTGRQLTSNTDPCRYQVGWSGSQYSLTYFYAPAGGSCAAPASPTPTTYALKGGVAFSSAGSAYYRPPHAANDISGSKLVVLTKNGSYHSVCLYGNGRVLDQAGQLSVCP